MSFFKERRKSGIKTIRRLYLPDDPLINKIFTEKMSECCIGLYAMVWGGGAAGTFPSIGNSSFRTGGGGGGYSEGYYDINPLSSLSITVGKAGLGITSIGELTSEANGGTSLISYNGQTLLQATGGGANLNSASTNTAFGGVGSGGILNNTGGNSIVNVATAGGGSIGTSGGGSAAGPWGDGKNGGIPTSYIGGGGGGIGTPGKTIGGGGGGGFADRLIKGATNYGNLGGPNAIGVSPTSVDTNGATYIPFTSYLDYYDPIRTTSQGGSSASTTAGSAAVAGIRLRGSAGGGGGGGGSITTSGGTTNTSWYAGNGGVFGGGGGAGVGSTGTAGTKGFGGWGGHVGGGAGGSWASSAGTSVDATRGGTGMVIIDYFMDIS